MYNDDELDKPWDVSFRLQIIDKFTIHESTFVEVVIDNFIRAMEEELKCDSNPYQTTKF